MMCSRRQLPGMKNSSSRDAGSMAPATQLLVPSGNHGYILTWDVPSGNIELRRDATGNEMSMPPELQIPCLVCGMHSYGKRTEERGVACRSRSWNLTKVRGIDHPAASHMS